MFQDTQTVLDPLYEFILEGEDLSKISLYFLWLWWRRLPANLIWREIHVGHVIVPILPLAGDFWMRYPTRHSHAILVDVIYFTNCLLCESFDQSSKSLVQVALTLEPCSHSKSTLTSTLRGKTRQLMMFFFSRTLASHCLPIIKTPGSWSPSKCC